MSNLPLVQEALNDSMPGCRLTELLRERYLFQQDPSALANLVEKIGKKEEADAWIQEQPEFKQFVELRGHPPSTT